MSRVERHEWIDAGTGAWLIEKDAGGFGHIRISRHEVDLDTLKTVLSDEILRLSRELELYRRHMPTYLDATGDAD